MDRKESQMKRKRMPIKDDGRLDTENISSNPFSHRGSFNLFKRRKVESNSASVEELTRCSTETDTFCHTIPSSKSTIAPSSTGLSHQPIIRRTSSRGPDSSLVRVLSRKPLASLQSSMRQKVSRSVQKNAMKGQEDYSMTLRSTSGQLEYLRFLTAMQPESTPNLDHKDNDKDVALRQKIDREIRMRDGAVKLLYASKYSQQAMEATQSLIVSNARVDSCMAELQRRRTAEAIESESTLSLGAMLTPCRAIFVISDIRLPLMWRDYFVNRSDVRRYAVFCLIKIGDQVLSTDLIPNVDRQLTDLTFTNALIFHDIGSEFICQLELYCHKLQPDQKTASTPQKIRRRVSRISLDIGRRLSGIRGDADILEHMLIGPKFECIARSTLTLKDVTGLVNSYPLASNQSRNQAEKISNFYPPLFSHYCCRLAVRPDCLNESPPSGWINVKSSSAVKWQTYWCRLSTNTICGWLRLEDIAFSPAVLNIVLAEGRTVIGEITVGPDGNGSFSIICENLPCGRSVTYTLVTENFHETNAWHSSLLQRLADLDGWKQCCETEMKLPIGSAKISTVSSNNAATSSRPPSAAASVDSPITHIMTRLNIGMSSTTDSFRRVNKRRSTDDSRRSDTWKSMNNLRQSADTKSYVSVVDSISSGARGSFTRTSNRRSRVSIDSTPSNSRRASCLNGFTDV